MYLSYDNKLLKGENQSKIYQYMVHVATGLSALSTSGYPPYPQVAHVPLSLTDHFSVSVAFRWMRVC